MRRNLIVVIVVAVAVASSVDASVLCQRRSGALFVRDACKKKEVAVNASALGLVGPAGDAGTPGTPGTPGAPGEARAYACSDVSFDGTLVAACVGRPSKNVVSIIANPLAENVTCFVLDPSIDAASSIAVASFADAGITSSVNIILNVIGTNDQVGCPANSVVVRTGRFRQADAGNGMLLEAARLAVNVAVM
ncbi:MAG TPA: hypothetical protein VGR62_20510 [Candidatus Binatia bacterium]|jgi:hypothetical protein|nr:hypothetical protein [Candidatus Binatia bacterium]